MSSTSTSIEERERVLAEQEKALYEKERALNEREKDIVSREKVFDRGDLDQEWEDIENAREALYQTELGQRSLALDEREDKLKMKKQQLTRWTARIIQIHQDSR